MFNSILTYFIHQRKALKFIEGAVVAVILIATYVPCFASSPAENPVTQQAATNAASSMTGSQQALPDDTVTGNTKVLVLEEAGSHVEVRTEKKLAAYINSSEEGFEIHIASDQKGLAAYINATVTPIPANLFTHRIISDTPYYLTGPQQASPADGVLAAGVKVRVLQSAGSYLQVYTESGLQVYIATNSITPLAIMLPTTQVTRQEDWQNALLENGWQNYDAGLNPAGYFKDTQGIVHLRGVLTNNTNSSVVGSNLFVLPEGYRPARLEIHAILSGETTELGRIDIFSDGGVQVVKGQPDLISLDGITFRAE